MTVDNWAFYSTSRVDLTYFSGGHFFITEHVAEIVQDMRHQVVDDLVERHIPPRTYPDQWDGPGLYAAVMEKLG